MQPGAIEQSIAFLARYWFEKNANESAPRKEGLIFRPLEIKKACVYAGYLDGFSGQGTFVSKHAKQGSNGLQCGEANNYRSDNKLTIKKDSKMNAESKKLILTQSISRNCKIWEYWFYRESLFEARLKLESSNIKNSGARIARVND